MTNLDNPEEVLEVIKSVIYRFKFNNQVLEEIVNDAFIKVYEKYPSYRGDAKLTSWIAAVARNTYLSEVRRKTYKIFDTWEDAINGKTYIPEEHNVHLLKSVIKRMDKLKKRDRDVVTMRVFGDRTTKEVAEELNLSETHVKYIKRNSLKEITEGLKL